MLTCPCNVDLTPHFYLIKTGVYSGIFYFRIFALKHLREAVLTCACTYKKSLF